MTSIGSNTRCGRRSSASLYQSRSRVHNIDELHEQRLIHVWRGMNRSTIDNALYWRLAWAYLSMCTGKWYIADTLWLQHLFNHVTINVSILYLRSIYRVSQKSRTIFEKCMTTVYDDVYEESVQYIKVFSSLSGVRLLFWMSSYLNILCISSEKRYYTENTINLSHEKSDHFWQFVTRVQQPMTHFVKCRPVGRENEDDGLLFCIALRLWSSWLARTALFSQAEPGYIFYTSVNLGEGDTRGKGAQSHLGAPAPLPPYIATTDYTTS